MRKQAAKIKVSVITAAFLIAERDFFKAEVTVSDKVVGYLDNVWFHYEQFKTEDIYNKLDENIRLISKAIDELVDVQIKSAEYGNTLDTVLLEKIIAELEVARIICYEEKMHYIKCKEVELGTLGVERGEN